ncbi:MAG: glycosyltransferase, partial [Planctomycetaceae bacterium]|nr:glycosyltransferase [Planctomycetaceae bacterium]
MLSVIVPVYNEEATLVALVDEVQAGVAGVVGEFEIIFVDDGSTDA